MTGTVTRNREDLHCAAFSSAGSEPSTPVGAGGFHSFDAEFGPVPSRAPTVVAPENDQDRAVIHSRSRWSELVDHTDSRVGEESPHTGSVVLQYSLRGRGHLAVECGHSVVAGQCELVDELVTDEAPIRCNGHARIQSGSGLRPPRCGVSSGRRTTVACGCRNGSPPTGLVGYARVTGELTSVGQAGCCVAS